jgi:fido (protein-threonine AMPylation protein)
MNNTNKLAHESSYHAALRQALAISRLMALQKKEADKTSYDVENLHVLFEKIHREAYSDERYNLLMPHPPGEINEPQKKAALRMILKSLVDPKNDKALFDENKFAIYHEPKQIAEILADLYYKVRELKPFSYGNDLTLDFFIQTLGNAKVFRRNYGEIDLTRIRPERAEYLHDPTASRTKLTEAFKDALNPSRTPHLQNKKPTKDHGYKPWKMQDEEIKEWRFLSVDVNNPKVILHEGVDSTKIGKCLVRVDGGLVPLSEVKNELERLITSRKPFADFPPVENNKIVGHLAGTEDLSKNKDHIDGFAITKDAAPLFCLDANILSGLTKARHDAFMSLMRRVCKTDDPNIHKLNDSGFINDKGKNDAIELKNRLIEAAKGDYALQRSVEIATEHINRVTKELDQKKLLKFDGAVPVPEGQKPKLIMSMGGPGSAKSAAEDAMQIHCGKNYVRTSLDDFRDDSDLYHLLIAAGHHGDDYGAVEPFANALRTWVADEAAKKRYNLLYDGSGIEFAPRYRDKVIRPFRNLGYETEIVGAERDINVAVEAVIERAEKPDGRTLPWKTILEKHSQMPASFMSAAEEASVEKISLLATDDRKHFDKDYLIAESFVLNDNDLKELEQEQKKGVHTSNFKNYLEQHFIRENKDSFLAKIAGKEIERKGKAETIPSLNVLVSRIPEFTDENVSFRSYHVAKDVNRVLVIYDTKRFVKMMGKAAFNIEASDVRDIEKPIEQLKFLPQGSWTVAVGLQADKNPAHTKH